MSDQPERSRWVVLLLDGTFAPAVHAAWVIDGTREFAGRFAAFVTQDIDPAIVVAALDPVAELLGARDAARADAAADEPGWPMPAPAGEMPGTITVEHRPVLTAQPHVGQLLYVGGQRYWCSHVESPDTGIWEYTLIPEIRS